jgi:glycosyltransferase involved in cell wall biosynthesis
LKLLILSSNPGRASFRQRIAVYIDYLNSAGFDCEIAKLPRGVLARRRLLMRAGVFDGVFLHKKILNPFDAYYLKKYAKKIIYDLDDAIMFDDKHPEKIHRKRQNSFRRTARLADLVIAGNAYLAEQTRKFNSNVEILPTGLDITSYQLPKPPGDGNVRLVWIGSRPTLPNLKLITPTLEEIGKRFNNVVLRIICDEFFDLQHIQVEKRLWTRDTEVADLVSSDIGLAPLDDNAFTRGKCGFKILQYAAAGLPTVASPVGVNADYVSHGSTGFLAQNLPQWIEHIVTLINNHDLRRNMGLAARKMAANLDVSMLGKRLYDLINNCISRQ